MYHHWIVLLFASILEAACGYPQWIVRRIGHPVMWMGACIARLDTKFNRPHYSYEKRRFLGCVLVAILLIITSFISIILQSPGSLIEIIALSALLAQRSLYDHVHAVYEALRSNDIENAREKVSHIVGRDVQSLDMAGVSRAAIESLAESFSDGIIAPMFWAALLGLPGIACYKAINTADSMIGHKDERYGAFGWAGARLDDCANWVPARISGCLLVISACLLKKASVEGAWNCMWRDARRHASPNAGWPEAAMAGALDVQLAGPQTYDGVEHEAAFIGDGTRDATPLHLRHALRLYVGGCMISWLVMLAFILAAR